MSVLTWTVSATSSATGQYPGTRSGGTPVPPRRADRHYGTFRREAYRATLPG
ncbi:hypothetical protein ACGFIE_16590 [Micromonospora sp. NPDC049275]|uniref:hypothetical protein n=1 Tax=Micromonospora sp. NPDC049275 TaxID=3364268 RepID=UPI0037147B23